MSTGSSSHDQRTDPPSIDKNANTGSRFSPRLNSAPSTTDSGTASRGNSILRTSGSRCTSDVTLPFVASEKNPNRTIPKSSASG